MTVYTFYCNGCKARPKVDGWCQVRDLAMQHLQRCGGKEIAIRKENDGALLETSTIKRFEEDKRK